MQFKGKTIGRDDIAQWKDQQKGLDGTISRQRRIVGPFVCEIASFVREAGKQIEVTINNKGERIELSVELRSLSKSLAENVSFLECFVFFLFTLHNNHSSLGELNLLYSYELILH